MTDTTTTDIPETDASQQDPVPQEPATPVQPAPEPTPAERLFATRTAQPGPPEVSPDGQWMAYLLENASGTPELWLTPLDGAEAHKLELPFVPVEDRDPDTGRAIRGPQWSPDGLYIALTGKDEGAETTSIWVVPTPVYALGNIASAVVPEAETGTEPAAETETVAGSEHATEPETGTIETAATSGDDTVAAASAETGSGDTAISTDVTAVEPSGEDTQTPQEALTQHAEQEPLKLIEHPFSDRSPRWSPDGQSIAFVHRAAGRDAIAMIDVSGTSDGVPDILTWSERDDREPVWSRDGKFLAFTRQIPDSRDHADIVIFAVATGEVKNLTGEKTATVRHTLDWVPGRNLIGYVTVEGDWLSISVVNADNKAGWVVTRESGDKFDMRFAPSEARLIYLRSEGFATVVAERGLHASGAVAIDPGEGVAMYPRWTAGKRVVYGFSAPHKPLGFLTQENLASAERTPLAAAQHVPVIGANLRHPLPFEYEPGPDEQFSGLVYRSHGHSGPVPGVVYLPDGPLATRLGAFQIEEQALANSGLTVATPVLHGSTGFGQAVIHDLADLADREVETNDLAAAGLALIRGNDIDPRKLALVGDGFGGTLALLTAGARPGIFGAVVAIDPITDWRLEFAEAQPEWRSWLAANYGLPRTSVDRYALRTPSTFAAVIDVPVVLVATATASAGRQQQLETFQAYLDASGVEWERLDMPDQPKSQTLYQIGQYLADRFYDGDRPVLTADAPVEEAVEPEGEPAVG